MFQVNTGHRDKVFHSHLYSVDNVFGAVKKFRLIVGKWDNTQVNFVFYLPC